MKLLYMGTLAFGDCRDVLSARKSGVCGRNVERRRGKGFWGCGSSSSVGNGEFAGCGAFCGVDLRDDLKKK